MGIAGAGLIQSTARIPSIERTFRDADSDVASGNVFLPLFALSGIVLGAVGLGSGIAGIDAASTHFQCLEGATFYGDSGSEFLCYKYAIIPGSPDGIMVAWLGSLALAGAIATRYVARSRR